MRKYLATLMVLVITASLIAPLDVLAASQPPAPKVTANDVNNTVLGMKTTYEYSLDGAEGVMYRSASFATVDLSGNHEFLVRVAATSRTIAGKITTLRFTENPAPEPVPVPVPAPVPEPTPIPEPTPVPVPTPVIQPAAPVVTGDDVNNTVSGMKATYEYSINGANGVMYDSAIFSKVDLSGDIEFRVRVAETATTPAGLITTLQFTKNPVTAPAPLPVTTSFPPAGSIFSDGFEGSMNSAWYKEFPNSTYSGKVSSNFANAGTSSFRIELRKTDPNINGSKRSELALLGLEDPAEQHTYNFGILLPSGGAEDYALDPKGSEIIAQWHNVPDSGEQWTTPPLALRTFNGRYVLERCWDDAAITTDAQMTSKGNRATYDLGSYTADKGKFVSWSFKVKWGWLASQNPKIEIYKNGSKVLSVDGPNTTNDKKGNNLKLGIYKWDWAQTNNTSILSTRVIYFDSISIE